MRCLNDLIWPALRQPLPCCSLAQSQAMCGYQLHRSERTPFFFFFFFLNLGFRLFELNAITPPLLSFVSEGFSATSFAERCLKHWPYLFSVGPHPRQTSTNKDICLARLLAGWLNMQWFTLRGDVMAGGSHSLMAPWGLKPQPGWRALTSFLSTKGVGFKVLMELSERDHLALAYLPIQPPPPRPYTSLCQLKAKLTQPALRLTSTFVIAPWALAGHYAESSACHGRMNVNCKEGGGGWSLVTVCLGLCCSYCLRASSSRSMHAAHNVGGVTFHAEMTAFVIQTCERSLGLHSDMTVREREMFSYGVRLRHWWIFKLIQLHNPKLIN